MVEEVFQMIVRGDLAGLKAIAEKDPACLDSPHPISGKYPLQICAAMDAKSCLEFLVSRGVDVNRKVTSIDPVTGSVLSEHTALMHAYSTEAVEILVSAGADVNAVDGLGKTALEYAFRGKRISVIRKLVELGAKPLTSILWDGRRMDLRSAVAAEQSHLMSSLPRGRTRAEKLQLLSDAVHSLGIELD